MDRRPEIDPATQLHINEELEEHRKLSDERYAAKLVERIVFGAMALIAIAVLTALLTLVIRKGI